MQVPVPIRRQGYRVAHRMLRGWWFITRPHVQGVKCVLSNEDSVVLVRHTYGHSDWELPGGGVRRDESPADAARREMEEELGVRLDELASLGHINARPYRAHDQIHCFQAELSGRELTMDEGELAAAEWFRRDELPADLGAYVTQILALSS